jgi:guanylate kinase
MLIILGKTASGKNTIVNKLVKNYGFKQLVTYTTRPKRKGEIEGVTYHYISLEEFKKKDREGFFAESSYFCPASGGEWAYGTSLEDFKKADDKTVLITNPRGYYSLLSNIGLGHACSIYIIAKEDILLDRLEERGDSFLEAQRRIVADREDFEDVGNYVDFWIANDGMLSIEEIASKINFHIEQLRTEREAVDVVIDRMEDDEGGVLS